MPRLAISPGDRELADRLTAALDDYTDNTRALPGINSSAARDTLVAQIIDSDRRRRYASWVRGSNATSKVAGHPISAFQPLMAATHYAQSGDFDEACWLVFLATHFGYHRTNRWALSGNFYHRLGDGGSWTWPAATADTPGMRRWLDANRAELRRAGGPFGNHRKYVSLSGSAKSGTGEALETYIDWVGTSHSIHFDSLTVAGDPKRSFAAAYVAMDAVTQFGRTARFDYLTMLGKLGIVDLEPDKLHLLNATGPLKGARLICCGNREARMPAAELEHCLQQLGDSLGVSYDILEDALCNWQKSPNQFTSFRG